MRAPSRTTRTGVGPSTAGAISQVAVEELHLAGGQIAARRRPRPGRLSRASRSMISEPWRRWFDRRAHVGAHRLAPQRAPDRAPARWPPAPRSPAGRGSTIESRLRDRCSSGRVIARSSASMAPQPVWPMTTTSRVPKRSAANSTLPTCDGATMLPATRMTNRSPSPWSNTISAGTRESEQPSTIANGDCTARSARRPWLSIESTLRTLLDVAAVAFTQARERLARRQGGTVDGHAGLIPQLAYGNRRQRRYPDHRGEARFRCAGRPARHRALGVWLGNVRHGPGRRRRRSRGGGAAGSERRAGRGGPVAAAGGAAGRGGAGGTAGAAGTAGRGGSGGSAGGAAGGDVAAAAGRGGAVAAAGRRGAAARRARGGPGRRGRDRRRAHVQARHRRQHRAGRRVLSGDRWWYNWACRASGRQHRHRVRADGLGRLHGERRDPGGLAVPARVQRAQLQGAVEPDAAQAAGDRVARAAGQRRSAGVAIVSTGA